MTTLYEWLESRRAFGDRIQEVCDGPLQCQMPENSGEPLYRDAAERRVAREQGSCLVPLPDVFSQFAAPRSPRLRQVG